MSAIADVLATKQGSVTRKGRKLQGLRKLSSDLISKAIDETNAQVTRIGLTFLGTAAFCLLSLLSPDSALLGDAEKINVPLAGPVSFFGFMVLGPAVLIMLRVYLQIYVEHSNRLERLGQSLMTARAPTLVPLKNSLMRAISGLTFYLVLPTVMLLFAWRAAAFPAWGSGLLCVAVGVSASHAMLSMSKLSWRSNAVLSVSAAIIAAGVTFSLGPLHRPFDLGRANLSNHLLPRANFSRANLSSANLTGANLSSADLTGADLSSANLTGADLSSANLTGANLIQGNLTGAALFRANLSGAQLNLASLSGAKLDLANLSSAHLDNVDLSNALLVGANLSGASAQVADLNGANILGAKLRGTVLSGVDLSGANLSHADLSDANLFNARLGAANLRGSRLGGADLRSTNLAEAKNLNEACGSATTKLPEGVTLEPCPAH